MGRRRRAPALVLLLTLLILLTLLHLTNAPTARTLAAGEGDGAPLLDFAPVDDATGWVLTPCALYWTTNAAEAGGPNWRALRPPGIDLAAPLAVAFADTRHGLVVQMAGGLAGAMTVAQTADAGVTWRRHTVALLAADDPAAQVARLSLQLIDARSGWLVLHRATSSNFSLGALFFTADGGVTWTRRPLLAGEEVTFRDALHGWTRSADGATLQQTRDGATTWQPVVLAGAAGTDQQCVGLPVFAPDRQHALLPVRTTTATGQHWRWYASADAGATWQGWAPLHTAGDPRAWLWQHEAGRTVALDIVWPHTPNVTRATYTSAAHGWGSATGAGDLLLRTRDGGRTWQPLMLPSCAAQATSTGAGTAAPGETIPPVPPADLVSLGEGPAFDACELPTPGELAVWRTASPYRVVNLYIGGALRACPNHALTAAALSALADAGWRFIPTWVGPQAPCSDYRVKFSAEPEIARTQGRGEARQALVVAQELGLTSATGGGTVIYYDLEAFDSADAGCVAAAQAFVQGWSAEMRGQGSLAGLYAAACLPPLGAYALTPAPDAVWVAQWVRPAYDPAITVWGIACLDDSLWNRGQRIRQYTGGHDETWGGVTLNIDANIVAGPVADPALDTMPSTVMVVEEALLQPAADGNLCSSAWYRYQSGRGFPAYLTLNRRLGDPPPLIVNSAAWQASVPVTGAYQVEVYMPAHPAVTWECPAVVLAADSAGARYTIEHAQGATTQVVDQMTVRNGWLDLGRYPFTPDRPARLTLVDETDEVQFSVTISVSAARFTLMAEEITAHRIWLPIAINR